MISPTRQINPLVTVEFYGVPRLRAERETLTINAKTLEDVWEAVVRACPKMANPNGETPVLGPHYLLSINGDGFVTDLSRPVAPGDRILMLSADVGG